MFILQMTGLSGAGKSTLAYRLQEKLIQIGLKVEVLDGDVYRRTLCSDLGFSEKDRKENIRRLGIVCSLLSRNGVISILSAINPFEETREALRQEYPNVRTIWIDCSLEELRRRDTKGLYRLAGLPPDHPDYLEGLTGVNAPYELPQNVDLTIRTDTETIEESVQKLFFFVLGISAPPLPASNRPKALFIGRWQPFHHGHRWLIEQKLDQDIPVMIAVRDMPANENNPFTTLETMAMIKQLYKGRNVEVICLPDIESVNYGRQVGYEVNCFIPPADINTISGSAVRAGVNAGDSTWKDSVDPAIHELILQFLNKDQ